MADNHRQWRSCLHLMIRLIHQHGNGFVVWIHLEANSRSNYEWRPNLDDCDLSVTIWI